MYLKRLTKKPHVIAIATLFFLLVSFDAYHKFYVSVTQIEYSNKDSAIQITSRLFIDDLENALKQRYGVETFLASEKETKKTDYWMDKYLHSSLKIFVNDDEKQFVFLGKKYDNDLVICYLEVKNIELEKIKRLEVQNLLLTDVFDEQQNITHIKLKDFKKSFVLNRSNNKGMLNL